MIELKQEMVFISENNEYTYIMSDPDGIYVYATQPKNDFIAIYNVVTENYMPLIFNTIRLDGIVEIQFANKKNKETFFKNLEECFEDNSITKNTRDYILYQVKVTY